MENILVKEIMSRNPVIVNVKMPVNEAAKLMSSKGVSTLVVEDEGKYVGIVTDRDMIVKILAEDNDPRNTCVGEIMSHPIIMISGEESISTAARVMSRRRIRKLPVVQNGEMVGLLSENDIVRIAPDLVAIASEYSSLYRTGTGEPAEEYVVGRCEACGQYSLRLRSYQGMLVCPECYDSMKS